MKVSIEHTEVKKGLLKKKTFPAIKLSIEFSPEEIQCIETNELKDLIIWERGTPADQSYDQSLEHIYDLTPGMIIYRNLKADPDVFAVATPNEANEYVETLKSKLTQLKDHLDSLTTEVSANESFEL